MMVHPTIYATPIAAFGLKAMTGPSGWAVPGSGALAYRGCRLVELSPTRRRDGEWRIEDANGRLLADGRVVPLSQRWGLRGWRRWRNFRTTCIFVDTVTKLADAASLA